MSFQKIHLNLPLVLCIYFAALLKMIMPVHQPPGGFGNVDSAFFSAAFQPCGDVDVVAPDIKGKLGVADHPCNGRSAVDTDAVLNGDLDPFL